MTVRNRLYGLTGRLLSRGAERISWADIERLSTLTGAFGRKLHRFGPLKRSLRELPLLMSLIRDYGSGRYRRIPWWAISSIAFALLYLMNPLDLIPDFIPILGHVDDILVVSVCLSLVDHELKRYRVWKDAEQPYTGPGADGVPMTRAAH